MANKVYVQRETSRTWSDTGTTSDELLDLGGLTTDNVSGMGSYHDWGVAPRSEWYEWILHIAGFASNPVAADVGLPIKLFFAQANGTALTDWDGEPDTAPTDTAEGTLDGTAADRRASLANLTYAGAAFVRSQVSGDELRARGIVRLTARYVSPVVHNTASVSLLATSDDHLITLTPIPPEIQ